LKEFHRRFQEAGEQAMMSAKWYLTGSTGVLVDNHIFWVVLQEVEKQQERD